VQRGEEPARLLVQLRLLDEIGAHGLCADLALHPIVQNRRLIALHEQGEAVAVRRDHLASSVLTRTMESIGTPYAVVVSRVPNGNFAIRRRFPAQGLALQCGQRGGNPDRTAPGSPPHGQATRRQGEGVITYRFEYRRRVALVFGFTLIAVATGSSRAGKRHPGAALCRRSVAGPSASSARRCAAFRSYMVGSRPVFARSARRL